MLPPNNVLHSFRLNIIIHRNMFSLTDFETLPYRILNKNSFRSHGIGVNVCMNLLVLIEKSHLFTYSLQIHVVNALKKFS